MDPTNKPRSAMPWVLALIGLPLFAYAAVRAGTVSFSYDECYTFLEHVRKDRFYQDRFDQMGGNHHLLNVWLMWASWKLFGDGEFALRLPSLAAYALYLFATGAIALRSRSPLLAVGAFLGLNLHPYLIDLFSLARGYALGNAFMMLSLWQATCFLLDGGRRSALGWASAFAALAAMSHVIMVNYLLAFTGALAVALLFSWRLRHRAPRGALALSIGIGATGLLIILPNAIGLLHGGSLNFGCDDLWKCSMRSLAEKLVYHLPYRRAPLVLLEKALWWCVGACALSVLVAWRAKAMRAMRPFLFGLSTLGLCVLAFWLQQRLFGVPLPRTRTALFLLPLAAFTVVAALQAWPRGSWAIGGVSLIGCVPLAILFHDAFNTRYAVEWKSAGELRRALEIIADDHLPLGEDRPAVNVRAGFETNGGIVYHVRTRHWHWLARGMRSDTAFGAADYYLVEYDAHHLVDTLHWTKLFHSPQTGFALYRDERARRDHPTTVHSATYSDTSHEAGRFPELQWVVPADWTPGPVLITGWVDAMETADSNWIGLFLEVRRHGRLVAIEDRPSHEQLPDYGTWRRTNVMLLLPDSLFAGDSVRFAARPCFPEPRIALGEAELRVMR